MHDSQGPTNLHGSIMFHIQCQLALVLGPSKESFYAPTFSYVATSITSAASELEAD